jgi:hypothetical protein
MRRLKLVVAALLAAVLGASGHDVQPGTASSEPQAAPVHARMGADPEKIRAHVRFLAGDVLEGRGTGQRGGDIAAEYIATQFALSGLRPAGDKGTYFQGVPFELLGEIAKGFLKTQIKKHTDVEIDF